jgi:hypothetical protein
MTRPSFYLHNIHVKIQTSKQIVQTISTPVFSSSSAFIAATLQLACLKHETNILARAGFEPAIPVTKRPQTYALDPAATGIGSQSKINKFKSETD